MIEHSLSPVLIQLGPIAIHYYGLFYVLGICAVLWYLLKFSKVLDSEAVFDYIFVVVLSMIIFARLAYVLVYDLQSLIAQPISFFMIWKGGLSFHGGLLGVFIGTWLFKRYNQPTLSIASLADELVIPISLALSLGRLGNFFNGELYGTISTLPWCMQFPGVEGCRHPSQLYESFKNILIFCFLIIFKRNCAQKIKPGFLFWLFVTLYGLFRFTIQLFWRFELTWYLGLSKGGFLCLIMIIIGLIGLRYTYKNRHKA